MALGWRTLNAMPRLRSYADADRHEANTKPIRGRTPEIKPLGRRNQTWHNIKREENGDILVQYGDSPLLRYRPDDTLLVYDPGYWNKASYNDEILEVTGIRTETKDGKMWAHVDGGRYLIRPSPRCKWIGDGKYEEPTEPVPENIFRRVEKFVTMANGRADHGYLTWTYVNPPSLTAHYIKRKEMRAVRERYAAFTAYAKALDSIREHSPEPEEYVELFDVQRIGELKVNWWSENMPKPVAEVDHADAARLCSYMLSEDATDNYKAYLWLKRGVGWMEVHLCSVKQIERVLTMHHHAEVLTRREAAGGKATKDRYAWAVPK